jgi:hypothetical protein
VPLPAGIIEKDQSFHGPAFDLKFPRLGRTGAKYGRRMRRPYASAVCEQHDQTQESRTPKNRADAIVFSPA